MKVSKEGLELIKKHEGLRLDAYRCPAGVWTIGYGITSSAGVGKVVPGMKITHAQAEDMLRRALGVYEQGVLKALNRAPTQNQFDALVSFAFNVGVPAMSKSSVIRHYTAGDLNKAANAFSMWNKAKGKVLPGLTRRRAEERALFLKPSAPVAVAPAPAPTPAPAPSTPEPVPAKPGATIAGWVLGILVALIAAAAAFIAKGS
jgi:lysozyme